MIFKDKYTQNIFCDASIKKSTKYNSVLGCSGAISVINTDDGPVINNSLNLVSDKTTNNLSELRAIDLAVMLADNKYKTVNIFSDSQISVYGLRDRLFGWLSGMDMDGIMYSTSGDPVANQDAILNIASRILKKDIFINMFHQKGHVDILNYKSLGTAIDCFYTSNDVPKMYINCNDIKIMSSYNNIIDKETRSILDAIEKGEVPSQQTLYDIVKIIPDPFFVKTQIKNYNKLINRGGYYEHRESEYVYSSRRSN